MISKTLIRVANLVNNKLYHTSYFKYKPGDVIKPYWKVDMGDPEVESKIEEFRLKYAPDSPSRLNSVFCWPDMDRGMQDLSRFHNSGRTRFLYEVEPVGRTSFADLHAYNKAIRARDRHRLFWAKNYWEPRNGDETEVLAENGVRIKSVFEY